MKKVLIISYFYPPVNTIASIRIWKLVKYIREYGWDTIVISSKDESPDWHCNLPEVPVYRIPCNFFMEKYVSWIKGKISNNNNVNQSSNRNSTAAFPSPKIISLSGITNIFYFFARSIKQCAYEVMAYPDDIKEWQSAVITQSEKIINFHRPDIILSSACPWTSHIIACYLSKKYGIPWVADYRDLWTQSHYSNHTFIRRYFEEKLEIKTLLSASEVVTVSVPAARVQSAFLNKEVKVITNGYDPDDYDFYAEPYDTFTISYTGSIYSGKRDPSMLFSAVKNLIETGRILKNKIRIKFIGAEKALLENILKQYEIDEVVEICDRISLDQAIIEQKKATVLLLLMWNHNAEKGVYTGKVFEYLGAKRPILAIPTINGSVVDELLDKTQAGISCSSVGEVEDILLTWYQTFYCTGKLPYEGIDQEIGKYSRKNQAKQFANLFDSLSNNNGRVI